jgi:hypothetical protein
LLKHLDLLLELSNNMIVAHLQQPVLFNQGFDQLLLLLNEFLELLDLMFKRLWVRVGLLILLLMLLLVRLLIVIYRKLRTKSGRCRWNLVALLISMLLSNELRRI